MRSLLFVPADDAKKLGRSLGAGADALILDLEDSVAPARKAEARRSALAFLRDAHTATQRPMLIVRVNALSTGETGADLEAVLAGRPDAVMLPKAEGGAAVIEAGAKLAVAEATHDLADGGIGIFAIATETALSLFRMGTFVDCSPRLRGMTWGAEDLSQDLGAEANRHPDGEFTDPYRLARALCIAGASAARVAAIDTVYVDFRNSDGLRREAEAARRDGFTAKMAIHPAQVPVINEVFTPSSEAIAEAQKVVAAFAGRDTGVVAIDGVMFDKPHLERAKRVLARAGSQTQRG